MQAEPDHPPPRVRASTILRRGVVGIVPLLVAAAFGYAGGWLDPARLTPAVIVDDLQRNAGLQPGYRRNHAKGVCVVGHFDSTGAAARHSRAALFAPGRTPLVGRFAIGGGNPAAADGAGPVRSLALRLTQADGQQWRTGMNNMPVFPVSTPTAFRAQLLANRPDPATGKPDPAKQAAFFAAHPEAAVFRAWAKSTAPSRSYADQDYYGLNAFVFVDANGRRQPVRWRVVAEASPVDEPPEETLEQDLVARLRQGPLRWTLHVVFAAPGDPTADATRVWPADRPDIVAGEIVLTRVEAQDHGACRDLNFDPLVLPDGIQASDDPLLPARSAVYAVSHLRRTSEGTGAAQADRSHGHD
ncbi:MAG TPA: catalase family peroxidase [Luteimonas sp.]|nr:catalase family peroxidase [Luteimonas sp.]HRO26235.1 catalase family peroxidase [Luteimonas sp.]HRP71208.1 catalase family peroxidase [Luteimonas sp.]